MKVLLCALALAATTSFAGNANAETLDGQEIQRLLQHPEMLDNSELSLDPATQTKQITAMIEVVFEPLEAKIPGIISRTITVIDCETHNHRDGKITHLDGFGNLIKNAKTGRAKGAFQIVPNPHNRVATAKGLDLNEIAHQVIYAKFLIEGQVRRGNHPLEDWRSCWA